MRTSDPQVIHVVPAVSEEASGPTYSVVRLCESLIDEDVRVALATLDWASIGTEIPFAKVFALGMGPRRLGRSPALRKWLAAQVDTGTVRIIHSHSLWMMPNVYPAEACRGSADCHLVTAPRGTLSRRALSVNSISKRIFWRALQGPAVDRTACFHATSDAECDDIRVAGFRQPVCVLPNGVDIPAVGPKEKAGRRRLLFLGRLDPIKGIDVLLKAWRVVSERFGQWDLQIVGPDSRGYLAKMRALAAELNVQRVSFAGPVYGAKKVKAFRNASLFVLPSHSENFGMAVAEALAAGTPVVVSKYAPWFRVESEAAGWATDVTVDALVACLEHALSLPEDELDKMGVRGREWMAREFSWQRIAAEMKDVYNWLELGGSTPTCVRMQ